MMTVATRLRQLIACSLSSSFTLFPFESSGRIFYFHFKPFLVVFLEDMQFFFVVAVLALLANTGGKPPLGKGAESL